MVLLDLLKYERANKDYLINNGSHFCYKFTVRNFAPNLRQAIYRDEMVK